MKLAVMQCIFCPTDSTGSPVEHIVPESLGNDYYVLPAGVVCAACNNRFSKWENKAIRETMLGFFRIRNAVKTKKGNPSSMKIGNLSATGDADFKKDLITFYGLEQKDIVDVNPVDGSFRVTIPDFHKTDAPTSKMLLKIAYESLYKSNQKLLHKYDFASIKNYLTNRDNRHWPFITSHRQLYSFKSIPTFNDKYQLAKIKCTLSLAEENSETLLFDFHYDIVHLTINLLHRDYGWAKRYFDADTSTSLYPMHLKKP